MIPTSVSASALEVAEQCLARYKALAIEKGTGFKNSSALLGTTLHSALEKFVDPGLMRSGSWDWDFLVLCYEVAYEQNFGVDKERYDEGLKILRDWFNRPDQQADIQSVEILSREVKKSFQVPYVLNGEKKEVPCNYIIDRFDKISDKVYRVVDYKSQIYPLVPNDLRNKIQARIYALAVQIEYPDAEGVWVEYDFLRYDRVSTLFTRDDNVETWRWLKRAVQRIVDTSENDPPETLNENCRYCVRRFRCSAIQTNIRVDGIYSLNEDQLADLLFHLTAQEKAIKSAKEEVELQLLRYADKNNMLEWEANGLSVKVTSKRRRVVDNKKIREILGPLANEYIKMNLSDIDKLREDDRLTDEQKSLLDTAISYQHSDPGIKVTKKVF